ncbi:phage holin family protein [Candidatus Zixiibacteriota bacterium]
MPKFVTRWLVTALAIVLASYLMSGVQYDTAFTLIMAALVLGLLNAIVRPVLVILTLPITMITLGLFLLVVNAITLKLTAAIVPGFGIEGTSYIWAALLITVLSWFINLFIRKEERREY